MQIHHHGVDWKENEPIATCKCGATLTNPFMKIIPNQPFTFISFSNLADDWGTDEDYFDWDGEQ